MVKEHDYRLGYRADLEGLRAVAVLLVVAAHAGVPLLQGGFVGVDVFFVLSGFLITGLLLREVSDAGRVRFLDFYVRRLRRLLPALLVMILVTGWLASLLLAPSELAAQAVPAAMAALWASNLHFALAHLDYFAPGNDTNLFLHTWSLGVEEQFYLVWPALIVWLVSRPAQGGIRRLKIGLWSVLIASLASCVVATYLAPRIAFYMMPLRGWQFASGALAWIHFAPEGDGVARSRASISPLRGWLGLSAIVVAAAGFRGAMSYPGFYALLPTVGAVLIIQAGRARDGVRSVSWWLATRPMQFVGRVSYSWYLWHWPVLLLGRAWSGGATSGGRVACVLVSFVLAVASHFLVERPVRESTRWISRPRPALFSGLAVMVLACSLALGWGIAETMRADRPPFARYQVAHKSAPGIYRRGCDNWYYSDQVTVCLFGNARAAHTVVLMGDSHAAQWFSAVAGAVLRSPQWRLLVLTKSSCPMVDVPFFYARIGREYTECERWRDRALERVASLGPDLVILGTTSDSPFGRSEWIDGTKKVLKVLSPSVGQVILLRDTPKLPFDGPDCLARLAARPSWLASGDGCNASSASPHAQAVYSWLESAGRDFKNVHELDLNSLVCPSGFCSAERDGRVVFRDDQHLTDSFAASMAPALRARLIEMDVLPVTR